MPWLAAYINPCETIKFMSSSSAIGILRMPMGNLRSVYNAVFQNGFDPLFVEPGQNFDDLTHLIVPGVGNFRAVMEYLEDQGISARIRNFSASGRPLLGICAGMQALAELGAESGQTLGLGLVQGRVERLEESEELLLPHVGWSGVKFCFPHPVTDGVKPGRDFYFVHSYAIQHAPSEERLGESHYGVPFSSIVARGNVVGFQFHPEKSQTNGLKLIENFCRWDGRC